MKRRLGTCLAAAILLGSVSKSECSRRGWGRATVENRPTVPLDPDHAAFSGGIVESSCRNPSLGEVRWRLIAQ